MQEPTAPLLPEDAQHPLSRHPIRLLRAWLLFSAALITVSLLTGWRASQAAHMPQYLVTKTTVQVEKPYVPTNAEEAAQEAAFIEDGQPPTTVTEEQSMFVLGLLDAAAPAVIGSGLLCLACHAWRRRAARIRIAHRN